MQTALNATKATYDRAETSYNRSQDELKRRRMVIADHAKQIESYDKALKVWAVGMPHTRRISVITCILIVL